MKRRPCSTYKPFITQTKLCFSWLNIWRAQSGGVGKAVMNLKYAPIKEFGNRKTWVEIVHDTNKMESPSS